MYAKGRTIRIILADDHEIFREGFRSLVQKQNALELVAEARDGSQLPALVAMHKPDVILCDIRMPGMDGIAATRELSSLFPQVSVIALTMFDDDHLIMEMLEAGAKGYLLKDVTRAELAEAVESVFNNETYYCQAIRQKLKKLAAENRFDPVTLKRKTTLTRRETEVILLICEQKSTKEIAALLHISERTVDHLRMHLINKTGSVNVAGLIIYAVRHGLIKIE